MSLPNLSWNNLSGKSPSPVQKGDPVNPTTQTPISSISKADLLAPGGKQILLGAVAVLKSAGVTSPHAIKEKMAAAFHFPFSLIEETLTAHSISLAPVPKSNQLTEEVSGYIGPW